MAALPSRLALGGVWKVRRGGARFLALLGLLGAFPGRGGGLAVRHKSQHAQTLDAPPLPGHGGPLGVGKMGGCLRAVGVKVQQRSKSLFKFGGAGRFHLAGGISGADFVHHTVTAGGGRLLLLLGHGRVPPGGRVGGG